jgi:1,5-anhydro-D-fructose reductase (1,5-anhydro-D-mannitol-forming)
MTLRWALLGPGRHAGRNVVTEMKTAAGNALAAVVSRDAARSEAFARQHGIAKAYTSLDQVLADPDIDAVYDATPDGLHAANAIACAQAGKHVLIEKPLAISVAEGARVLDAAHRAGIKLGVVFQQRHDNAHVEARRRVLAGEIGEVVLAHVFLPMPRPAGGAPPAGGNWRADPKMRPGGIASSIGDHAHDTLSFLVAQKVIEVSAVTDAFPDRVAALALKLSGGAIGYAAASFRTPYGRRPLEIHGTAGSIMLTNSYAPLVGADGDPTLELVNEKGRATTAFPRSECYRKEFEAFANAVENDRAPATSGEEALHAVAITEAIYESSRTGKAVKVA